MIQPNAGVCEHGASYPDLCRECMTFEQEIYVRSRDKAIELMGKLAKTRSYESVQRLVLMADSLVEFYQEMEQLRKEKEVK